MGHTFTNHLYHMVFTTKNRKPLITSKMKDELYKYMCGIARNHRGKILRVNGVEDHVHLLAKIQPAISVSDFVRLIKANSSKWISEKFSEPSRFAWQDGYSSFTVSESNFSKVANYIATQEEHRKKLSFQEELEKLLEKHGIETNKRRNSIASGVSGLKNEKYIKPCQGRNSVAPGVSPRFERRDIQALFGRAT